MKRWRSFILIGLIFAVVALAGVSVVSAAQSSLPGQRIYSVKLLLEQVRLTLAADDVARARIHLECLDLRLTELGSDLSTDGEAIALEELDKELTASVRAVAALPGAAQGDMRTQLARLALRAVDMLARRQSGGPNAALLDRVLAKARALADAASDPNARAGDLLRALERFAPIEAGAAADQTGSHNIPLPADLVAKHQPPLSGRHAEITCEACHENGKVQGLSPVCTTCHQDPHESKFERVGFGCFDCHTDVVFSPSTFDHVRFPDCQVCHEVDAPLNHYPGQCSNCHTSDAWTPANFNHTGFTDCISCHAGAAPPNHYPGQCSDCHTTKAWTPANFNHSGFTDCTSCHSSAAPPNHYPGQCSNCHTTNAWTPANFNHSGFADCTSCHSSVAPPNHYPGQCGNCHTTDAWRPANFNHSGFTDCATCHAPPGNHFPGQCSNCHGTDGWRPASFNHSGFTDCGSCHAPPGNHFPGQCSNCHGTGGWRPANFNHSGFTDCASCHAPPPNHFAGQCSDCHNTSSWEGATFNHSFPLNHHNAKGNCSACHPGGDTGSWSCDGCHEPGKMDEKHKEIGGYSDNCLQCHADGKKPKDGAEIRRPGPIVAAGATGGSEVWAGLLLIGNVAIGLGLRRRTARRERDRLLDRIAALDDVFAVGGLDAAEYRHSRAQLKARLKRLMRPRR